MQNPSKRTEKEGKRGKKWPFLAFLGVLGGGGKEGPSIGIQGDQERG